MAKYRRPGPAPGPRVTRELRRAIKIAAAQQGRTVASIEVEALTAWLEKRRRRQPKRRNPVRVEGADLRVRLFRQGEWWYVDLRLHPDNRIRRTMKTTDRSTAEQRAREFLRDLEAEQALAGQVVNRLEELPPERQREIRTHMILERWGADVRPRNGCRP